MPHYHFNLVDGWTDIDRVGVDLDSLVAAQEHAAHYASDVLREQGAQLWSADEWQVDVTDHSGLVLCSVLVMPLLSPALKR